MNRPTNCKECRKEIEYCYLNKDTLAERSLCFNCNFWTELFGTPNAIVMESHGKRNQYMAGPDTGRKSDKGFGGQYWKIKFNDGRILETNDLWHQGEIPEHFYGRFPVNAEVVK